jgi:hypothetical protein
MEAAEFGDIGYAVIDVEALLIGPRIKLVEQVAFILVSPSTGQELLAEKHMVYQPLGVAELVSTYGQPKEVVEAATSAYTRITDDVNFVHADPMTYPSWSATRNRIRKILRRRAIKVYAKGAALERAVFKDSLFIDDLEWSGCPKYPLSVHDPLLECRFFARFIPELQYFYANTTHHFIYVNP